MNDTAIAVLTAKSVQRILDAGGSQSWVLDRANARKRAYCVCMHNAHHDQSEGTESHGSVFMIGRISDITPSADKDGRWLIEFSEYAVLDLPVNRWEKWRNPVRYTSLTLLGIDPTKLKFKPMPAREHPEITPEGKAGTPSALTISEAKLGLALAFGVSPDAVEITIRG